MQAFLLEDLTVSGLPTRYRSMIRFDFSAGSGGTLLSMYSTDLTSYMRYMGVGHIGKGTA